MLDGACRIPQLVQRAADLGMPAVGLTDHGIMAGAVELYKAASKAGIKPLLGCEVYVVPRPAQRQRDEGERSGATSRCSPRRHAGYHNLVKLCTLGYLEGYYYKPRVDYELLERYADGLICLSGCMAGVTCQALARGRRAAARAPSSTGSCRSSARRRLRRAAGRRHARARRDQPGLAAHRGATPGCRCVGTSDVHYLHAEDAEPHDALLCIQTSALLADQNRFRFATEEFYLKTPAEMRALIRRATGDDLLAPTLEIAERCNVELELGALRLPRFDEAERRQLRHTAPALRGGARAALRHVDDESDARLEFELQTITRDGLRRLLPDRLGLRALRQAERHHASARAAARRRARSSPTACRSPTSTRSRTTCCSSAS